LDFGAHFASLSIATPGSWRQLWPLSELRYEKKNQNKLNKIKKIFFIWLSSVKIVIEIEENFELAELF